MYIERAVSDGFGRVQSGRYCLHRERRLPRVWRPLQLDERCVHDQRTMPDSQRRLHDQRGGLYVEHAMRRRLWSVLTHQCELSSRHGRHELSKRRRQLQHPNGNRVLEQRAVSDRAGHVQQQRHKLYGG